jgi:hypothetical protein
MLNMDATRGDDIRNEIQTSSFKFRNTTSWTLEVAGSTSGGEIGVMFLENNCEERITANNKLYTY